MNIKITKIPNEHHSGIRLLATISEHSANSLLNALIKAPPLSSQQSLTQFLLSEIQDFEEIGKEKLQNILNVLFSLYDLLDRTEMSATELAAQVSQAIEFDNDFSPLNSDQTKDLSDRLVLFLGNDETIALSYKTSMVLSDHKCLFTDARLFTDMRPIFKSKIESDPLAIGIVHTLKILYRELEGNQEFFVSLDLSDLQKLNREIQRAMDKETALRNMLERVKLPTLKN